MTEELFESEPFVTHWGLGEPVIVHFPWGDEKGVIVSVSGGLMVRTQLGDEVSVESFWVEADDARVE